MIISLVLLLAAFACLVGSVLLAWNIDVYDPIYYTVVMCCGAAVLFIVGWGLFHGAMELARTVY